MVRIHVSLKKDLDGTDFTTSQHNVLHLTFTLLQCCNAVVGAETKIQALQLNHNTDAVEYEWSLKL